MSSEQPISDVPVSEGMVSPAPGRETGSPPSDSLAAPKSEAYLDIVWKQFKKNRFALWSLRALLPLFLMAIFAPAIASNQPFVFFDGDDVLFPWFRHIFNPREPVDFVFNMAMVGFVPWLTVALVLNWRWKRREAPGRRRVLGALGLYGLLIGFLAGIFSVDALAPDDRYYARTFVQEEFESPGTQKGLYPPVPLGPIEQSRDAGFKGIMWRKAAEDWQKVNDGFPHLLGTDGVGRDVFVQMIYGTRISLTVGFVAVGIYLVIGVVIGALAGYFGGFTDIALSRAMEVMMLFPSFFLILTLVALIGPSIYIIMLVIGVTSWAPIARLIRGEVLKQRSSEYVLAARALGSSHLRIVFRHILPNSLGPALVSAPFGVAGAIVTEAGLSLLGVGVRPPTPTWGILLKLGNENYNYWWLIVLPSLAMFFTVTVFNLVGSGLRDAMDPRLRM
jgi:peptide/nickel transport system permease protein